MSDLGQQLKNARQEKGLSLEDIQSITKIQKRYLESIENGEFQHLPGPFYMKAFVKSYAEAVGLDPEALLAEYGNELPKASQTVESLPPRKSRSPVPSSRRKLWSMLPGVLVFVLVVGLLAVIWALAINDDNNQSLQNEGTEENSVEFESNDAVSSDGEDEKQDHEAELEENQGGDGDEEETDTDEDRHAGEWEITDQSGDTTMITLRGTDEFRVGFSFSGESWLKIEGNSGETYVNDGFSDGEKTDFDFSEEEGVRIRIGSTPNMSMALNGKEVALEPTPVAQTVRVTFEQQ